MSNLAILIPCYNEALTIASVIDQCRAHLPDALIYVYDNGSTDDTVKIAKTNGAIVRLVATKGKGNVVRQLFADVEADIYILIDGDATYDISVARLAIDKLRNESLDMLVCARQPQDNALSSTNAFGNKCFTYFVNSLFRQQFTDIFSGYRIFSRRFVKSFPAISQGFEIEAEMTIHALQLGIPWQEFNTPYFARPEGSTSKLQPFQDGMKILWTILWLFLQIRPMLLFSLSCILLLCLSLSLGFPIVVTFMQTGLVPRIPTAILSASLALLGCLCLFSGIVLDGISRTRLEAKRFWYLRMTR